MQELPDGLLAAYLSQKYQSGDEAWNEDDPVSYTHLDVYKIQHKFLKKPKSFKIVEDNDFEEEEEETPVRGGASCAVDPVLYSMLKDLRKKLSLSLIHI